MLNVDNWKPLSMGLSTCWNITINFVLLAIQKHSASGLMFLLSMDGHPSCYSCQVPPWRMSKEQNKWSKWLCHTNLAPAPTCQAHAPHSISFWHGRHEGSLLLSDDMNHAWFLSWTLTFAIFLLWQIARLDLLLLPTVTACIETYQISTKVK